MPSKDIFDQIQPDKGDIFDQIAPDNTYQQDVANRPSVPKAPTPAGLQPDKPTSLLDRLKQNVSSISAPNSPDDSAFERFSHNFVRTATAPVLHPLDTASGILKTAATNMPGNVQFNESNPLFQQAEGYATSPHPIADIAGDVAGSYAGGKILGDAAEVARPALEATGSKMQDAGIGIMNKGVLGSRLSDIKRGANPGRGYLQAGGGPALTMRGIAKNAGEMKANVGGQIGDAIDNATANGTIIPTAEGVQPIAKPLNQAHAVMSGPGGGGAGAIEDLAETFRPDIQTAIQNGGFTPRDLFDIKKNVAENTSWGDPTQLGLKSTRQRIAAGLSDTTGNYVPGLKELNQQYQDLTSLNKLSNYRANTGQTALSQIGRHTASALTGGVLGYATHNPFLTVAPIALDSLPLKTTAASSLFKLGGSLPDAAVPLSRSLGGAGSIFRPVKPKTSAKGE